MFVPQLDVVVGFGVGLPSSDEKLRANRISREMGPLVTSCSGSERETVRPVPWAYQVGIAGDLNIPEAPSMRIAGFIKRFVRPDAALGNRVDRSSDPPERSWRGGKHFGVYRGRQKF